MIDLYPLLTQPRLAHPIWGGTTLATWLDMAEPRPERLGEIWLVYDANPVVNGPLAGRTLADVARAYGAALVGERTMARYGADVPLLAKFIDAADRLSIQVHPDDAYAHRHEASTGFHGKTEAWHIIHAAPGAEVIYGLARPTSRAELAAAIATGELEPLMRHLPVVAGDTVFVPAGTLHAINAGIVLFEIQQKSDLTYRVYDYGRHDAATGLPRELHVAKALDVAGLVPAPYGTIPPLALADGCELLVACPYFALERWSPREPVTAPVDCGTFEILTVLDGAALLRWRDGALDLRHGDAVVIPASLGDYTLAPATGILRMLRVYVPDLARLRDELLRRGIAPEQIAATVLH